MKWFEKTCIKFFNLKSNFVSIVQFLARYESGSGVIMAEFTNGFANCLLFLVYALYLYIFLLFCSARVRRQQPSSSEPVPEKDLCWLPENHHWRKNESTILVVNQWSFNLACDIVLCKQVLLFIFWLNNNEIKYRGH